MSTLTWHPVTVREITNLQDAYLLLRVSHSGSYRHLPGQHCVFRLRDDDQEFLYSFSIASRPRDDAHLDFCIALQPNSRLSRLLKSVKVGGTLTVSDAVGGFILPEQIGTPYVFVAGGSGIAPIRAMIQELLHRGAPETIHLLYGCRDAQAVPYLGEIQALHATGRVKAWVGADKAEGGTIRQGRVTDWIAEAKLENARYILCGPSAMVDAVCKDLLARGVPSRAILFEKYGP